MIFKNLLRLVMLCFLITTAHTISFAQGIGVNVDGNKADKSAMLDISATNKGILIPRVALQNQFDKITVPEPAHSLLVFNINAAMPDGGEGYYYNSNTPQIPIWVQLSANNGVNSWLLSGNSNLTDLAFMGTTDDADVIFKREGEESYRVTKGGAILATGNNNGVTPFAGAGTRMMWIPAAKAFRVGEVSGIEWNNNNIGNYSLAAGFNTLASGTGSTALGVVNLATGNYTFASGINNKATKEGAIAMGRSNVSQGDYSITLGDEDTSTNEYAFAAGNKNKASNDNAIAIGRENKSSGIASIAIGSNNIASANYATAVGYLSVASGTGAVSLGIGSKAEKAGSTAFGFGNTAQADYSTAMGALTKATADYATSLGLSTTASGKYSLATGNATTAIGESSFAAGITTEAVGKASIASGSNTHAIGDFSTATGGQTTANGSFSTSAGNFTTANGAYSTAMGVGTTAQKNASVAMGFGTQATGEISLATGFGTTAQGNNSTAFGVQTKANSYGSFSIGMFNNNDDNNVFPDAQSDFLRLFQIGNGTSENNRRNAMTVLKGGQVGIRTVSPSASLHISSTVDNNNLNNWNTFIRLQEEVGNTSAFIRYLPFGVDGGLQFKVDTEFDAFSFYNEDGNKKDVLLAQIKSNGDMEIKGDYGKISDMRLKENVSPIVNVLNKINHIQPIYYNLKNNNETFTNRHIGFSAQELQKEFPELVVQNKDGHLSARYDNMTAVLLQGVKEQQQQIEGLKAQKNQQELFNQQLIKQNEALIKRLEKLEQKSTD